MLLSEYKKYIDVLVKDGHGRKVVVTASDDEGNQFNDVFYAPKVTAVKDIADVYRGLGRARLFALTRETS